MPSRMSTSQPAGQKAPVAHDGHLRVAQRLLGWGTALAVLCVAPQLAVFAMGHGNQRSDRARLDLTNIQNTLRVYRKQTGGWPPEERWAEALVTKRLLEREPMDPWDHPYRYRLDSTDGGELEPRVTSIGRDGVAGTEDDLDLAENEGRRMVGATGFEPATTCTH